MQACPGTIDIGWLAQSREFADVSALLHNLVGIGVGIFDPPVLDQDRTQAFRDRDPQLL